MANERYDRRYGGYSGDRDYGAYGSSDRERSYGGQDRWEDDRARAYGDYGSYGGGSASRDYRGERFNDRSDNRRRRWEGYDRDSYSDQDRGFFDRAGDEVRSWFGDEEAERRRREDERNDRYSQRGYESQGSSYGGYRSRHEHDPHYRSWRDRHLSDIDRDYEDYRREHQARFESDFGSWRERRMQKRSMLGQIREHMEVVGSDDQHVGTVDRVAGDRIILTRSDPESGGAHHSLSCADIDRVEGDRVILDCSADQAKQRWRDESRGRALFEREDQGEMGDRALNRSFEGTYRE